MIVSRPFGELILHVWLRYGLSELGRYRRGHRAGHGSLAQPSRTSQLGALAIVDRIEDGIAKRQPDRIVEGFNKCSEADDLSPVVREQAAMSRVPSTPVDVWVHGKWIRGTVRACTVTHDGETCSAVVSYGRGLAYKTVRVDALRMRKLSGDPGCPAPHQDADLQLIEPWRGPRRPDHRTGPRFRSHVVLVEGAEPGLPGGAVPRAVRPPARRARRPGAHLARPPGVLHAHLHVRALAGWVGAEAGGFAHLAEDPCRPWASARRFRRHVEKR